MNSVILRSICITMITTILICANFALADHGIHNTGLAPAQTNSMLQLQQSMGSFEVNGEYGRWTQSYLQGEYIITNRLSTMLGVPWSRVQREGKASVVGLGDLSLALRGQLYSREDTLILFALNSELPTGDDHRGLGGGHFEIAPMFILAHRLSERFTLTASVTHGVVIDNDHAHESDHGTHDTHDHGHTHEGESSHNTHRQHSDALIRPHGEHETISTIGLLYNTKRGFIESSMRFGFGVDHNHTVIAAPFELRLQGGLNLDDGVALTVGSAQTIIGPRRNPWVVDLGIIMLFGSPSTLPASSGSEKTHNHHPSPDHEHTHNHPSHED